MTEVRGCAGMTDQSDAGEGRRDAVLRRMLATPKPAHPDKRKVSTAAEKGPIPFPSRQAKSLG
jgi:hypothetical protein